MLTLPDGIVTNQNRTDKDMRLIGEWKYIEVLWWHCIVKNFLNLFTVASQGILRQLAGAKLLRICLQSLKIFIILQ